MTVRTSIVTLAVAGLAWAAPAAQAMLLSGDSAGSTRSTNSVLAALKASGSRYHAQANYRNERFVGQSTSQGVRPDDRAGIRGI
jgi:hypothetical protein